MARETLSSPPAELLSPLLRSLHIFRSFLLLLQLSFFVVTVSRNIDHSSPLPSLNARCTSPTFMVQLSSFPFFYTLTIHSTVDDFRTPFFFDSCFFLRLLFFNLSFFFLSGFSVIFPSSGVHVNSFRVVTPDCAQHHSSTVCASDFLVVVS